MSWQAMWIMTFCAVSIWLLPTVFDVARRNIQREQERRDGWR